MNILQSRCFRKCVCAVSISHCCTKTFYFSNVSLCRCFQLESGVLDALCVAFSREIQGSAMAYYHFILHQLCHMWRGSDWCWNMDTSETTMQKKNGVNLHLELFLRALWCRRNINPRCGDQKLAGVEICARISPSTLFEQHLVWANRWSSSV